MFNSLNILTRSLSFGKILGGLSKTLNIANQIIPLYLKAKPMIKNANKTLGMLKELTKPAENKSSVTPSPTKTPTPIFENTIKKAENNPTFFL